MRLMRMKRNYESYFAPLTYSSSDIGIGNPFIEEIMSTGIEL
jgi:hypothetical protein